MTPYRDKAFAYLLLHSNLYASVKHEVITTGSLAFIEVSLTCDDFLTVGEECIAFGMDENMGKICPVQITDNWNPVPTIEKLVCENHLIINERAKKDHVIFFEIPQTNLFDVKGIEPDNKDEARFLAILARTAEIAGENSRGVLFIGGWGWEGAAECHADIDTMLEFGMEFFTRYPV